MDGHDHEFRKQEQLELEKYYNNLNFPYPMILFFDLSPR